MKTPKKMYFYGSTKRTPISSDPRLRRPNEPRKAPPPPSTHREALEEQQANEPRFQRAGRGPKSYWVVRARPGQAGQTIEVQTKTGKRVWVKLTHLMPFGERHYLFEHTKVAALEGGTE